MQGRIPSWSPRQCARGGRDMWKHTDPADSYRMGPWGSICSAITSGFPLHSGPRACPSFHHAGLEAASLPQLLGTWHSHLPCSTWHRHPSPSSAQWFCMCFLEPYADSELCWCLLLQGKVIWLVLKLPPKAYLCFSLTS